jgi:squalene-hopene/tetraprenyl-beta-curcumene cyclase
MSSSTPHHNPVRIEELEAAFDQALASLMKGLGANGHWEGQLSSSALSTATAVLALSAVDQQLGTVSHQELIRNGIDWLVKHSNPDGGWGDTLASRSNLSTSALVWAAMGAAHLDGEYPETLQALERYLDDKSGGRHQLPQALAARYGKDRTFSVPILMTLALSGRLGSDGWGKIPKLPFELAMLPRSWFGAIQLPVVSYALPALIAIGQVLHHHAPTRNPLLRLIRDRCRASTLKVLETLQPTNGGFLEATPLTSFVTMSLASMGRADLLVARRGADFLRNSVRPDGSWPIDTNLSTWVTTLTIKSLKPLATERGLSKPQRGRIRDWLLLQQYRVTHPYTGAAPGGWAWTDLPGGVPDADDTAGALLALHDLIQDDKMRDSSFDLNARKTSKPTVLTSASVASEQQALDGQRAEWIEETIEGTEQEGVVGAVHDAAKWGCNWLMGLQNRDGGIPTFCRGWGALPFDRSTPELTAHALRAWKVWAQVLELPNLEKAMTRALKYLVRSQRSDGAWIPLWFGNEKVLGEENPVYGTAQVLIALAEIFPNRMAWDELNNLRFSQELQEAQRRGLEFLRSQQNSDGGWGGGKDCPSTLEETALALEACVRQRASHLRDRAQLGQTLKPGTDQSTSREKTHLLAADVSVEPYPNLSLHRGLNRIIQQIRDGGLNRPSPIGLYFAKLWYYEALYPQIFAVSALSHSLGSGLFNLSTDPASTGTDFGASKGSTTSASSEAASGMV